MPDKKPLGLIEQQTNTLKQKEGRIKIKAESECACPSSCFQR